MITLLWIIIVGLAVNIALKIGETNNKHINDYGDITPVDVAIIGVNIILIIIASGVIYRVRETGVL